LLKMSFDPYGKRYGNKRRSLDPICGSCGFKLGAGAAEFTKALVEREQQLYPSNFVSRLEQYVPAIMQTLGVLCIADFAELDEGQEAACTTLPVLVMNRFQKVLNSFRRDVQ
jgi:hypothetical protein